MKLVFAIWALFFAYCCLLSLQPCACREDEEENSESVLGESELEVTGKSSSSRASDNILRLMCDRVKQSFGYIIIDTELKDVYSEFVADVLQIISPDPDVEKVDLFYYPKPVPSRHGSVCEGVNLTCCKPFLEKKTENLASREYRFHYEQIFKVHSEACTTPGKRLHKSFTMLIGEVIEQIEFRVNQSLDGTLPSNTFRNISNFLISFSSVADSDTCPLPGLIKSQTQNLFQLALTNMFKDDDEVGYMLEDPVSFDCMKNVSYSFVKRYERSIVNSLKNKLQEIGVLVRSLRMAHGVITKIRTHPLSSACVTAITRMKYCRMCGGYDVFRPCRSLCLNTLKGCFADLAELHSDFTLFTSSLRVLAQELITELKPSVFIESHFSQFVSIVDELRENEGMLRDDLTSQCSSNDDYQDEEKTFTRKKRGGLKTIFQAIQDSKSGAKDPILEQLDFTMLDTVMEAELTCLERIGEKLGDVPDEVCFHGNTQIADDGDTKCWTGVTLGSYEQSQAGIFKADQTDNPVYSDLSVNTEIHYSNLIDEIIEMTSTINSTIALVQLCLQNDDEDCYLNTFKDCSSRNNPETGSNSGPDSDSGSGMGSGDLSDMETFTTDDYDDVRTETTSYGDVTTNKIVRPSEPTYSVSTRQSTTIRNFDPMATQDGLGNNLSSDDNKKTNPTIQDSDPTPLTSSTTLPVTERPSDDGGVSDVTARETTASKFTEKDITLIGDATTTQLATADQGSQDQGEEITIFSSAGRLRAQLKLMLLVMSLIAAFNMLLSS